jgi:hypothetical protein
MNMSDIQEIVARWNSGDGKPYKGLLIDWDAYQENPENMGCMCAQGQVLHAVGGWDFAKLRDADQADADAETAKLLNISRAHAILLRNINDKADGAPSIVLTDPGKVLGDQWSKLLDFWWMFDNYTDDEWRKVAAARAAARDADRAADRAAAWDAAGDAARAAAWAAARDAARDADRAADRAAAWDAAGDAARAAAWAAARDAARDAARAAAGAAAWDAAGEIQGSAVMAERGQKPFFLPMFGITSLDDIPARPDDYGLGVVPKGD